MKNEIKYIGFIWLLVLNILIFNGCSSKKVVEVDKFSSEIILDYSKKITPEGWFWNFGVGNNYGEAIKDASEALTFEDAVSIETNVIVSAPEMIAKKSNGEEIRIPAHKITNTTPKKVYSSENSCELHKLVNTKDGLLIIRICKDHKYFEQIKKVEMENIKNIKPHVMNNIHFYFDLKFKKEELTLDDMFYIRNFLVEITSLNNTEIWWNFPNNSEKDIENFILTTYKSWYKTFPKDVMFMHHYGIIYPYIYRMGKENNKKEFGQIWYFDQYPSYKFSLAKKLSEVQVIGLSEILDMEGLTLDKTSKVNFGRF